MNRNVLIASFTIGLLASTLLRAEIKTEEIDYQHGDVALQGYLAYDDAIQGKRPGVLVIPEWWGQGKYERRRATDLAKLGYVAFAVDMYGKGKVTDDPKQAGQWATPFYKDRALARARVSAALDVLKKDAHADPTKIAAIGYCFGGSMALELARSGADIAGVVSFHGGLDAGMPTEKGAVKAKILVCTGGDDPNVPPEKVAAFEKEMRDAGANWEVISYGGAVHSFTNPDSSKRNMPGVGYNEQADKRSWADMKLFFDEIFK